MSDDLTIAYNLGYTCAKDMARDEIERLRSENEKLRRAMHDIYEVYAGSEGDLKQAEGYYLLCLITEMSGIAAEHKK